VIYYRVRKAGVLDGDRDGYFIESYAADGGVYNLWGTPGNCRRWPEPAYAHAVALALGGVVTKVTARTKAEAAA
jgi:hypothetical protein